MNAPVDRDIDVIRTEFAPLLVLSLVLLCGWTVWALGLRPYFVAPDETGTVWHSIAPRLVFWVLPCGLYLHRYWGARFLEPLGLGFPLGAPQVMRTLVLTCAVSAFFVAGTSAQMGLSVREIFVLLKSQATLNLTAPVLEELVFRGVLLSELINWARDTSRETSTLRLRFWSALLLSSAVFVLVHFPFWLGAFGPVETLARSAPLLAFSMLLCFVFATTRSLWACIFLHYLNNQLSGLAPALG